MDDANAQNKSTEYTLSYLSQNTILSVLLFSNAKINLGLHVIEKRADGFHNIETVFLPIGWSDVVEALPHPDTLTLHTTGLCVDVEQEKNLCAKAFRSLQKDFNLSGADIFLHKQVPFGAGLGGGSSNATFVLRALNEIFQLSLSQQQLAEYAGKLGSDCAFFIYNSPMLATGRGEILTPVSVNLSGYELLVVKPPFGVSTAEAYADVTPKKPVAVLQKIINQPIITWRELLVNDFELSVFAKYPRLSAIKKQLYDCGATYAAMSGSGSSMFGIFKRIPSGINENTFENCITFRQFFS
ncbi:MAG: 4-(cytidine 5'-diphospho)-2-C-methyl-D-erythritol kinase [Prevotellaceae bacterium]|jgi:4-diphosphocytidyl-2-C-methyl-D-erythritol kinase|nr:4-(cytidine 5'-diphospho)-2-C-methyl-D-erythritol kinase [Prevotellaceae bacterium]